MIPNPVAIDTVSVGTLQPYGPCGNFEHLCGPSMARTDARGTSYVGQFSGVMRLLRELWPIFLVSQYDIDPLRNLVGPIIESLCGILCPPLRLPYYPEHGPRYQVDSRQLRIQEKRACTALKHIHPKRASRHSPEYGGVVVVSRWRLVVWVFRVCGFGGVSRSEGTNWSGAWDSPDRLNCQVKQPTWCHVDSP